MKTIAVIEKNQCRFDQIEEFVMPLLYKKLDDATRSTIKKSLDDYLWSVIEPFVKFIDIPVDATNDVFFECICQQMSEKFPNRKYDEFFYHTEPSYSFPKKYIEVMRCQPLWSGYVKDQMENINTLACLFSLKHTVMENTCIIIGNEYDLSKSPFIIMDTINRQDVLKVIKRRYFSSAVLIGNDGTYTKYYYQNPAYLIQSIYGLTEKDAIEKLSFSHLKYNLICYFQHDKTKPINRIATRINGLYRLHGDVLFLHELEENIFANISIREVKRLNVLSYGRLCDRELKKHEVHDVSTIVADESGKESEKNLTPFWSRYIVIGARMIEWQNRQDTCSNCFNIIVKNPIICDKCYRIKYCSEKCMQEHSYHSNDCINPKSY